ncbi:MAG: hypothetical protein HRT87_03790 [Legionellales bacterium]|nr:hypothetical protein [Legionellales bacterium]
MQYTKVYKLLFDKLYFVTMLNSNKGTFDMLRCFFVLLIILTNTAYSGAIDIFNRTNEDLSFSLHKQCISKNNNPTKQLIQININSAEKHRENFSFSNNVETDEILEVVLIFEFDKSSYILSKLKVNNIISAQITRSEDGIYMLKANTEKGLAEGILKSITPNAIGFSDIPKKTTWFDIIMYKFSDAYKYIRGLFSNS